MPNPYQGLPSYCFWNKAVSGVPPFALDPMVDTAFQITATDKVATAGSCFAQHIARRLSAQGFNYYIAENAPTDLPPIRAAEKNYGVFSARYGNVYTSKQLVQLFDRAYGYFRPEISHWMNQEGGFVDPFRPQVEPNGFRSLDELEQDRDYHLNCVREMFENLEVFVFTLGLTEGWRHHVDGAALPVAPGVAGGTWEPSEYDFVNSRAAEIIEDLTGFVDRLRSVNPSSRIILTVSPVPLVATYEKRHVLVSTVYSKSALRVAAEEVSASRPAIQYFPSYEIITSNANSHRYFGSDLRSVSELGVDHVMRIFFSHFAGVESHNASSYAVDLGREIAQVVNVVCEEDLIPESV